MLRKNSIVKFVFLAIIAFLGVLLCVCPFNVPASTNKYNGFISSIDKGIDINGGVSAEYNCTLPDGSKDDLAKNIDESLEKLDTIFGTENYSELFITRQGDNKIRIEASNARNTDYCFWYLEDAKEFSMTIEKASDTVTPKVFVNSSYIKNVKANYDYESQAYGLNIEFTDEGLEKLEELKEYSEKTTDKKVYIYLGEVNSSNLFNEFAVDSVEDNMFITASSDGTYSTSTYSDVKELSYAIISGSLGFEVELDSVSYISPKLGKNTQLYINIVFVAIMVLAFAMLIVKYRHLGLLGSLSLVFFLVLDIFFLQAIPLITLNLAGVFGVVLGFVLAVFSNIVVFEKIREEYAIGKKIHLSCKGGFKKALWPILDSHFILMFALIFMWIFAPASLKCFAIVLLVASLLSMFSVLVLTRYFVHIYLPINSTKSKKLGLYRDKNVKEIKEEVEIIPEDEVANSEIGGGNNE